MNRKKIKKIFSLLVLVFFCFLFFNFLNNTIYAEINSNYSQVGMEFKEDDGIIQKIIGFLTSLLLKLLAFLIVGVTWCIEKIVALIVGLLTSGGNVFPWADLSIFNGMAILDVNFINPAKGSLFMDAQSQFTGIGNAVRTVYFSGLSIALGFLGLIVAIMAIRMALSTIASEKAKYKEAIVHWASALILLFGMHYVIAFVFYLNEQLVEVASKLVQDVLVSNEANLDFLNSDKSNVSNTSTITLIGNYFRDQSLELKNIFESNDKKGLPNMFVYAMLYAIFVVQSVMFFWAYFKRFFYVLILSLIAPFVVVYNFLVQSIS